MTKNIIYYDGECSLCHFAVIFILKIDSKNKFFFSPLSKINNDKRKIDNLILIINV
ncbi:MAG: DCC1-like thiol-disulfide oxidoreductase family protein [Candidatus Neomarinimicrobiota bacterium]